MKRKAAWNKIQSQHVNDNELDDILSRHSSSSENRSNETLNLEQLKNEIKE